MSIRKTIPGLVLGLLLCTTPALAQNPLAGYTIQSFSLENGQLTLVTTSAQTFTVPLAGTGAGGGGSNPTLAITSNDYVLSPAQTATLTFQFSEGVSGFEIGDVSVTGGTLGVLNTVDADTYTTTVTPSADVESVNISVAPGSYVALDDANNGGGAALALTVTESGELPDSTPPTLNITAADNSLEEGQTVQLTFTFSEPVVDFDAADVNITAGNLTGFSGAGAAYTAVLEQVGTTGITVSVAAGSYTDIAGNNGGAASRALSYQPPAGGGGSCVETETVVCGYDLTWGSQTNVNVIVPAGNTKAVASPFTTGANATFQATLYFQPPAGITPHMTNFWISESPGGTAVSGCTGVITTVGQLKVYQTPRSGCALATTTTYYVNLRHQYNNSPAHYTARKLSQLRGEP